MAVKIGSVRSGVVVGSDSSITAANVTNLVFAEQEGSYLVGAIAAQSTQTDTVGFVGGVETDLIKKFEAGFTAGVGEVNKDAKVEVKYLTPDGDFSGFNDSAKGQTVASGLYDAGADVIFHAAGGSGAGVFKAAAEAKKASPPRTTTTRAAPARRDGASAPAHRSPAPLLPPYGIILPA